MAVLDGEGRLILAGAALALASGRPACELAGLQVGELGLFGEEAQRVTQAAQRAALDRQARNLDLASGLCVRFVPDVASPATAPQVWMLMQDHRGFHALEAELRAREREFRTLAEHSPDNIIRYGIDGRAVYCNQQIESRVKVSSSSLVGLTPTEGAPPGMRGAQAYEDQIFRTLATGERGVVELWVPHPDGGERIHSVVISPEFDGQGAICGALAVGRDVSEQVRIRQSLQVREREFRSLAENAGDNILRWNLQGRVLYANPPMARVLGCAPAAAIGHTVGELVGDDRFDAVDRRVCEVATSGVPQMVEVRVPKGLHDGEQVHQVRLVPERDEAGAVCSVLGVGRDITESIRQREFIESLARTDALTRLANRQALRERAPGLLAAARRRNGQLGVMILDVDQFKAINDSMGHSAGDELLCHIAARVAAVLRAEDLLVRLGGDEFVVLTSELSGARAAGLAADRIHEVFRQPLQLGRHEVRVSASIGVAIFPDDGTDLEPLLAHADSAMYLAKRNGRARTEYYQRELSDAIERRLLLEESLHQARHGQGLRLRFQPKVCLRQTTHLQGAEALLRWQHPTLGLLTPDQFIPLAEETGVIVQLGRWVFDTAAAAAARWSRAQGVAVPVAVNVSPRQLLDDDIVATVRRALQAHDCRPEWLEVEITESTFLKESDRVQQALVALRGLGLSVAIDDFGTGFSALNYLARFEVDCLKIDKSFVQGIEAGGRRAELVKAFVAMARALRLGLVAEGVETPAQAAFLLEQGCPVGQGFLFGQPVDAAAFEATWLGQTGGLVVEVPRQ